MMVIALRVAQATTRSCVALHVQMLRSKRAELQNCRSPVLSAFYISSLPLSHLLQEPRQIYYSFQMLVLLSDRTVR